MESESMGEMPGICSSSFTPINPPRVPVQFVSPQRTLHESGSDANTSFQPTLEAAPEVTVQKGRKRGTTQANKGRAISIRRVWEYRDEGDVAAQNQGADFESSFSKRRKSAPAKRIESTPRQPMTLQGDPKQDNLSQAALAKHQEEQHGQQLTKPPDCSKRGTKATPKIRKTKSKTGPFRNPVITKPAVPRETFKNENTALAKPVTIHQGWTSTEEAVKHKFNGISKTTLDKLAAFRYKSSTGTQAEVHSTNGQSLQVGYEPVEGAEEPALNSDYGCLPSDDPVFGEYYLDGQDPAEPAEYQVLQSEQAVSTPDHLHGGDAFFNDAIWNVSGRSDADENTYSTQKQLSANTAMSLHQSTVVDDQFPPFLASQAPNAGSGLSQKVTDHINLSSSEVRISRETPSDVEVRQRIDRKVLGVVNPLEALERPATLEDTIECDKKRCGSQLDLAYQIPEYSQNATKTAQTGRPHPMRLTDVQVERSDIDDHQVTPRDIPNDFEMDEFDDGGVDDADMLAIASEPVIPETQLLETGTTHGNSVGDLLNESPIVRSCANQTASTIAGDEQRMRDDLPSSPVILSDDEYPWEDGLEEEDMVSLPTHLHGVIETFQTPPSLEYSFANGPMSGEVYDKSLQFSPPKSRSPSVLPVKAAGGSLTDRHSPSKAQCIEDIAADPTEGEDWSFVKSNHNMPTSGVPILSDPMSGQEIATPDETAKRAIPLGPQKQRKRSTYAKIQPSTHSLITEEISLDDSHDYKPLQPFARPDFPSLVLDRCSIVGISAQSFLRVCFRVGEMFREGARCHALKQDAVIELFARITFSSREPGTTKQHFQFADLWHDRPPFPNGILANYKTSGLAESESRAFIGAEEYLMARCIGRLRRDVKNSTGWFIDIINVRSTDWEEIKWTKRIVSAGLVKSEKGAV